MAHRTEPKPLPRPRHPELTHEQLLQDLFELGGDIDQLIRKHALSPSRFLAFAKDPVVAETLAALDAFRERHRRQLAANRLAEAADRLSDALAQAPNPVETRRAATALARVAAHMVSNLPPRPRKPPAPDPSPHPDTPNTPNTSHPDTPNPDDSPLPLPVGLCQRGEVAAALSGR